jgi:hypothetical protein
MLVQDKAAGETAPYESMSPTLLAQQPPTSPESRKKPTSGWSTIYAHLESRMTMLRNWRYSWWTYWAVLAQFFDPKRYIWLVVPNRMWRGSPINDSIIDSTGQLALRTCAAGMWTGLTSPSRPWFKLGIGLPWVELAADAKAWLEDTEQRIYTVLGQSNFYSIMAQAFRDLALIGTAPILIYEDFEDVIRLYLARAGEYYLQLGSRLSVDVYSREFTYTVSQIVEFATIKNCPEEIKKEWEAEGGTLDKEWVVCHAIEPNFPLNGRGRESGKKIEVVPAHFTYREVYWLKGVKTDRPLSARGFRGKPFMTLKWSQESNDAYGRGPCMDALGDAKQDQLETYRKAEFIEKGVRPPMGASPELKNEPNSILPGHTTYVSTDGGKKGYWALFEVAYQWVNALRDDLKEVQARIEKCLFVDLFMAITRMEGVQPRNELELTKRDLERLQELGPVIDLAEKELDIGIRRILDILTRRRMLKPVPQSLQNIPLKITYTNIMRLAQKSAESIAMKDVFATAGALSSAAKAAGVPDPIRTINLDKALRHYCELNNFPSAVQYTDDEVAQHDQARAKAMQATQAPGQAMAAVDAAKTLADTPIQPGNALSAMLGPNAPVQGNA